jgi:hypothetical protein
MIDKPASALYTGHLSRRELIRRIGASSLTVAAASIVGPLALPTSAKAQSGTLTQGIDERTTIKATVDQYFKTKYESRRLLNVQDFGPHVADTVRARQFLATERDKRDVEIFQAGLFNLRYIKYNYSLDFGDIQVDAATKEASVVLSEGHDVVFACCAPDVSQARGIKHTLTLKQQGSDWKIVEDAYEDDMRRMLKGAGGKEQLETRMRDAKKRGLEPPADMTPSPPRNGGDRPGADGQLSIMAVGDAHAYDRYQAWYHAYHWWNDFDPAYGVYGNNGIYGNDDCTNFASQSLRAGGCAFDNTGDYQWFYYGYYIPDRTPSWTGVVPMWDYLVHNNWTGPNGVQAWVDGIELADIVQLDFGAGFQHTPVIVNIYDRTFDGIRVATHSDPHYNYPVSAWGGATVRFCHIMYWRE